MASGALIDLPIIDFAKAKTDREEQAKKTVDVLESVVFAFIDNLQGIYFKGLWDCCKWFFAKSTDFKRKIMQNPFNPENSNIYRGYFSVVPGEHSRKKGF
ncbi:hypothetical protein DPMN_072148 [Dreissena polymorpha]|uniref:Uncharacterized protein n=1 Tax=Dreissena polymorpha TaxID=45954 RepID=A0A9D3Z602_DREPO|nr:hypothetical protein DPMN_072148 [Dreissena polymorpha]